MQSKERMITLGREADDERLAICENFGRRFAMDLFKGNFSTHTNLASQAQAALSAERKLEEEDLMDVCLSSCGVPDRMTNALSGDIGIVTIRDVCSVSFTRMLSQPLVGAKTLETVVRKIISYCGEREMAWRERVKEAKDTVGK